MNRSVGSIVLVAGILGVAMASGCRQARSYPYIGRFDRHDPRFDDLVPPDARLERIAAGFDWAEGPVWIPDGGYLLFSDIPRNTIFIWSEEEGTRIFLRPAGYTGAAPRKGELGTNGLLLDHAGRLVSCEHGNRRVARLVSEDHATKVTLAESYDGKRLNSPNDAVYHSGGDLYFTDPPYGLEKGMEDPAKELDFQGVYRLTANGELTLLTKEMSRPNGIAFSPDEKTLYVANSDPKRAVWMAFDVRDDGTIHSGRVLFDATGWVREKKGLPDGMAVDQRGNLFATGPGGVLVISPSGEYLGSIDTGEATANCAWGDDGSTLYITADMYVCRIRLNTRGLGF